MKGNILLCSDCFKDEGLRLDSFKIGIETNGCCPKCKSESGKKLDSELIANLSHRFFVRGTLHRTTYGAAPVIQFNEHQKTSIEVPESLRHDIELIENAINVGFFYYGPRLWMIGEIEPLKSLQSKSERAEIFERIIKEYPTRILAKNEIFYRLRKNPENPSDYNQYDSPPVSENNRLDSFNLSILYGSQDLEVCLHECRVTVEDELFIATIYPKRNLNLLDLSELIEENTTEFESLDIAIHMLFYAGNHSYEISRDIALIAKESGLDGIIYPSYFSTIRTGAMPFDTIYGISIRKIPLYNDYAKSQVIPNIAIFGKPIMEGNIGVKCINRLILNKVQYDIQFGPVNYQKIKTPHNGY